MATQVQRRTSTRKAIVSAALAAFERAGSPDVALDAVAHAAGVTKGSVHYHFGNRAGLLEAVAVRVFSEIEARAADGEDQFEVRRYLRILLEEQAGPSGRVLFTIGDELLRVGKLEAIDPFRFLHERLADVGVAGSPRVIAGAVMQFGRQLAFGQLEPTEIDRMLDELNV